jgi:phosphohistidine phosphatase
MKTLILVRHAKSSWDDPYQADHDRPLNERGERDAPRMGKRLKEKAIVPDLLISSTATRARETARKLANSMGIPEQRIQTEKNLYHADEEMILRLIRKLPDTTDCVMLFGHNPGFTDFSNAMTEDFIDNIPTCGVVQIMCPADTWSEVAFGGGKVVLFDYPKSRQD